MLNSSVQTTAVICPTYRWCLGHDLFAGESLEHDLHIGPETVLVEFTENAPASGVPNSATIARSAGPETPDGYDLLVTLDTHVVPTDLAAVAGELEALAVRLRLLAASVS